MKINNEMRATLKLIEKRLLIQYEEICATPIRENVIPQGDFVTYLASLPKNEIENKKRDIEKLICHVDSLFEEENIDRYPDIQSFLRSSFPVDCIDHISCLVPHLREDIIMTKKKRN